MSKDRQSQSKIVPLIYGGIAGALLIVIAALALVLVPPSPPQVAEFAPQAQEQIQDAPNQQSSRFGSGAGACAAGQACEAPGASSIAQKKTIIEKARVRRCLGDPPRQTEDPQSPPCVNFWQGNNGGSTSKGVTRDEIRLGVAGSGISGIASVNRLVEHFNSRYEFYGRTIRPVSISGSDQRALAVAADEEARAFSGTGLFSADSTLDYRRELARRKLISVSGNPEVTRAKDYQLMSPYAWSYSSDSDELLAHTAEFVCKSLAGRTATFAGGTERIRERRFAIVVSRSFSSIPVDTLRSGLGKCGADGGKVYEIDPNNDPNPYAAQYGELRLDGVTTIILLAHINDSSNFMLQAPGDYQPEWILAGMPYDDAEHQWIVAGSQRSRIFGVFPFNKLLQPEDTPAYYALSESSSRTTAVEAGSPSFNAAYRALLLLASGVQLAGPNLTPSSFASALHRATFSNAGAGAPPYYQARVGFRPGDFTMTEDAAVVWWTDAAPSYGWGNSGPFYDGRQGGYCYVGRGVRFRPWLWRDVSSDLFDADPRNCR